MFKNYMLTAYKVFMRRKLFTAINLLCIVLTLVILLVATAMLENTFHPSGVEGKSDRFVQVVFLHANGPKGSTNRRSTLLGYKLIEKYLRPMKSVDMVASSTFPKTVSVYQEGRVSELQMRQTDANYWKVLDFKVLSGRVLNADDVDQGRFAAVINNSTATKLFPGMAAVGQKLDAGGQRFEVVGVVEDALHVNAFADLWVPVTSAPSSEYKNELFGLSIAMLLAKSRADLPAIKKEVEEVAKTVVFDDPKLWMNAKFWGDSKLDLFARLLLQNNDTPDSGAGVLVSGIALMMLLFMLLPALNLINLNMGRIMERSAEIGVRKAFGATSAQLVWQLVIENVLLCLIGGALGLVFAYGALVWIEGSGLIPYLHVELNLAVFGYGLIITLVFGIVSGVIPAWKMSRLDPVHALKGAA